MQSNRELKVREPSHSFDHVPGPHWRRHRSCFRVRLVEVQYLMFYSKAVTGGHTTVDVVQVPVKNVAQGVARNVACVTWPRRYLGRARKRSASTKGHGARRQL